MKKILIFFAAVFSLIVVAAVLFFVTFDVNRYKGLIAENLTQALGKPVRIDHIGLGWREGIALDISKLAVYPDASGQSSPGIELDGASAKVKFLPLLRKDFQFTSIMLDKPAIVIVREPDGSLQFGGIDFSKKSSSPGAGAAVSPAGAAALPFVFSIDSVMIRGGHVVFRDRLGSSAPDLEVKNLDLRVKNFSLTQSFGFEAAVSVFSEKQNIRISGKARMPQGAAPASLENFALTTDIGSLDTKKLFSAFPSLKDAGIQGIQRGDLAVEFGRLDLDPRLMDTATGQVTLKNGKIVTAGLASPVDRIDFVAKIGGDQVQVDHLTAEAAGGAVELRLKVTTLKTRPVVTVQAAAKELSLDQFFRNIDPRAPQLNGHLNLELEGQADGLTWDAISKTLSGRARINMSDGVLLNYNLLKEIIDKLSLIPGAENAFSANFPQIYRKRLEDQSTLLKPVNLQADIVNGVFNFNTLEIDTDFALINGSGQVGLDRRLAIRANLILNQEISKGLVNAFSPAQLLLNNREEITIPIAIQGDLPQLKIVPDTKYLTSKLLSGRTQELVQGLVNDPKAGLDTIQNILKKNLKGLNL